MNFLRLAYESEWLLLEWNYIYLVSKPLHPYETENFSKKKIAMNLIYQCKVSLKLVFGMLSQFIQSKKMIKIYVCLSQLRYNELVFQIY